MAAPHVTGVAALALSVVRGTPIRRRPSAPGVLSTRAPLAATAGKTVTGRLVNALRAIDTAGPGRHADQPARDQRRHDRRLDRQHDDDLAGRDRRPQRRQELRRSSGSLGPGRLDHARSASTTTRLLQADDHVRRRRPSSSCIAARTAPATSARAPSGRPSRPRSSRRARASRVHGHLVDDPARSASDGTHAPHRRGPASTVKFKTHARAIAVVGRRGPPTARPRSTSTGSTVDDRPPSIDLTIEGRRVQQVLDTTAIHSVKLVVVGGTGRARYRRVRLPALTAPRRVARRGALSCRGTSSSRTAPAAAGRGSCARRRSSAGRPRSS